MEAFQITQSRRSDNSEWPNWLNRAWQMDPSEGAVWPLEYPNSNGTDVLCVGTSNGVEVLSWDDWIIEENGELSVVKSIANQFTYSIITPSNLLGLQPLPLCPLA